MTIYPDESSADELEAIRTGQADVDAEMAEMHAEGDRRAAHQDRGYCTHGSAMGYLRPAAYPEQEQLKPGQVICTAGCGTIFDSDEAWEAACSDPYTNPIPIKSKHEQPGRSRG